MSESAAVKDLPIPLSRTNLLEGLHSYIGQRYNSRTLQRYNGLPIIKTIHETAPVPKKLDTVPGVILKLDDNQIITDVIVQLKP